MLAKVDSCKSPKGRKMSDPCVNDEEFFTMCEIWPSPDRLGPSLHAAVWNNDLGQGQAVLKLAPSIADWSDPSTGNCPLHVAARNGNVEFLRLLIDAGADVHKCSNKGYSALHVAAWADSVPCVELLLSSGCDGHKEVLIICSHFLLNLGSLLKSCRGLTPFGVAAPEVSAYLSKIGIVPKASSAPLSLIVKPRQPRARSISAPGPPGRRHKRPGCVMSESQAVYGCTKN